MGPICQAPIRSRPPDRHGPGGSSDSVDRSVERQPKRQPVYRVRPSPKNHPTPSSASCRKWWMGSYLHHPCREEREVTGSSPGSTHTQSIGGGDPGRVAIDPRRPHPARTARRLKHLIVRLKPGSKTSVISANTPSIGENRRLRFMRSRVTESSGPTSAHRLRPGTRGRQTRRR